MSNFQKETFISSNAGALCVMYDTSLQYRQSNVSIQDVTSGVAHTMLHEEGAGRRGATMGTRGTTVEKRGATFLQTGSVTHEDIRPRCSHRLDPSARQCTW
eukprot:m.338204 g.338204  ORF g.338204 m.338204 type:complete len:101 (+) comp20557_c0_seq33:2636-2938(+)